MDAHFYNSDDLDLEQLARDIVNVYVAQGFQAQQFGNKDQMLIQLKKGGDFEAILGMQAAVSLTIQHTAGGTLAMIGQQKWLDKAAVGTIGIVAFPILWPLALTAGAGALRQASLGNQVLNVVDGLVRQLRPGLQVGPIPAHIIPQVQQQFGTPQGKIPYYMPPQAQVPYYTPPQSSPSTATLHCPKCNTVYEAGDPFCSGCGQALTPQKARCQKCNTELKAGVAFCPKCGASTFQSTQAPSSQPASPQTPYYTPPTQQTPAPMPTYTPPTQQAPAPMPTYIPPTSPTMPEPYSAPTVAAQQPATPPPPQTPYYVPPITQDPPVAPQPKVTLIPGTPKQEPPATQPKPVKPQTPYYTPPTQSTLPPTVEAKTPASVPPKSILAKPASQPAVDANAPWGNLVFNDGKQVQLVGEHMVVGRYDHDLGGIQPGVDLGPMQGADTVSRIHATLEHIGSSYTLTDLNSTNMTRINGKRLEPDKATPVNDGDTLSFGKVTCTFKKL